MSLLENAATSLEKAKLLAVAHHDSGAWLNAFSISALGLCLDDSEVQIAISLHLGLPVCSAHMCVGCGAAVDERRLHGLSCRFSKGRFSRHSALNDLAKRSLDSAKIPSHLDPTGLYHTDGKRPDGATLVPWKGGRVLVWEVTCADTLSPSHRELASREARAVAASAEQRKRNKYAHLEATHHFVPIAMRPLQLWVRKEVYFFKILGGVSQSSLRRSRPTNSYCRGSRWQFSEAMLLQSWELLTGRKSTRSSWSSRERS